MRSGEGRAAHDIEQTPALELGERTRLFDADHISDERGVLLIMRVELLGVRDDALIECVRFLACDRDHDGLIHAGGDDVAYELGASGAGCCFCRHNFPYLFSPAATSRPSWRLRARVLTRATSLRNWRSLFKLSVWPMFSWKRRRKSWSCNSRVVVCNSTSVRLRYLSVALLPPLTGASAA